MFKGGIFEARFSAILRSSHLQWAGKRKFAPWFTKPSLTDPSLDHDWNISSNEHLSSCLAADLDKSDNSNDGFTFQIWPQIWNRQPWEPSYTCILPLTAILVASEAIAASKKPRIRTPRPWIPMFNVFMPWPLNWMPLIQESPLSKKKWLKS